MKVYYINLKRSIERNNRIITNLQNYGIPFSRVDAIDARNLSEEEVTTYYDQKKNPYKYFSYLNKAEIACFLSHRKALQNFLDSSEDEYMVLLEDDAEFIFDPTSIFNELNENFQSPHRPIIIKLYAKRSKKIDPFIEILPGIKIATPKTIPLSASAQIFNRLAAKKFLTATKKIFFPVDVAIQFASSFETTVLQITPNLTRSIDNEVGGSTISRSTKGKPFDWLAREFGRTIFRSKYWFHMKFQKRLSAKELKNIFLSADK